MLTLIIHASMLLSTAGIDGQAELQGIWKLTAIEVNGEFRSMDEFQPRVRIKGNSLFYAKAETAKLAADASAAPHTIDLQFLNPQRTFEGIYAVEGKTLKICVNAQTEGVKERPNALSTKGQAQWRIMIFEKETGANVD